MDRTEALRSALAVSPDNHALRLMLAEMLVSDGHVDAAVDEYARLVAAGALTGTALLAAGRMAVQAQRVSLLEAVLAAARKAGMVEGVGELEASRSQLMKAQDVTPLGMTVLRGGQDQAGPPAPSRAEAPRVTFTDVGGLDEVKKAIHRMIILPYTRPELYAKYGRKAGGGVLLYGPPGCGKTMLARATAGECGLPFLNVRIEDVLDPYIGVSERNLHDAFAEARARRPCVLFLDELDGLAFARGKQRGGAGRTLVDQLLQELDAIGADNRDVLILAATNAPWDVDDALKRPGRFDKLVFVPPPDVAAREAVLVALLRDRPHKGVDPRKLAKDTPLFSGADLTALVENAVDEVIEEALSKGSEPPLSGEHFARARAGKRASTLEWLARARNYVEFANQSKQYEDVATFLETREAKAVKAWEP